VAPIHVGNIVEVSAKVIYTGKTSMHIAIDVQASDPKELKNRLTTHCIVIMVAVDENGKPTAIPEWVPETPEDIALRNSAIRLMNMRTEIGEEMEAHVKYLKADG
jgi:acyl-CoA hydrolase